jgi:phosphonate transport system substrate-binding protein
MFRLKLASCMAENTDVFCRKLATYIDNQLGVSTEYVTGIPWQKRERLFDAGDIQILWICGLPYIEKADGAEKNMELLAVPIPAGERYLAKPVYFSDVVVRRDSPYQTLLDLRGAAWAYNEPRSHSGYNVVRAYLAEFGQNQGFFGEVLESGAHSASLEMVLRGVVDGTAIDSTVLEWILAEREKLAERIRVIDTFGPSPIPPWIISRSVPIELAERLRRLLLDMDRQEPGRAVLQSGRLECFVQAQDGDYDPIRRMARKADAVLLA